MTWDDECVALNTALPKPEIKSLNFPELRQRHPQTFGHLDDDDVLAKLYGLFKNSLSALSPDALFYLSKKERILGLDGEKLKVLRQDLNYLRYIDSSYARDPWIKKVSDFIDILFFERGDCL